MKHVTRAFVWRYVAFCELFPLLTLPGFGVEILVRCNYASSEQPLDRGQFRVS